MKTKTLFFLLGILFLLSALWIRRQIYLIGYSDPGFNTIYSSKFKEGLFNNDLLGKTENELDELFGKPLSFYTEPYLNAILYTDKKDSFFLNKDFNCVQFKTRKSDRRYRCFYLDSIGNVKRCKILGYDEKDSSYLGVSKFEIIKRFGLPDDEISNASYEVLSYSSLTKGVQSGKQGTIYIRQILLNRNKIATQIIKEISEGTKICHHCDCE